MAGRHREAAAFERLELVHFLHVVDRHAGVFGEVEVVGRQLVDTLRLAVGLRLRPGCTWGGFAFGPGMARAVRSS
jgi:hypothetical protein